MSPKIFPLGFGLLEVLAALALIAFAMLGWVNGLLSAHLQALESNAMVDAAMQAENIYEQMLANPLGVKQGGYYQMPGVVPSCNPCDPNQQAAKDLAVWQEQLAEELIVGEGEVAAYGNGQQIMIRWQSLLNPDTELSEWVLYGHS